MQRVAKAVLSGGRLARKKPVMPSLGPARENNLLRALPEEDFALLKPNLEPITLLAGNVITEPHQPDEYVFFPLSGLVSVTRPVASDRLEVGMIGHEGLVGLNVILDAGNCPNHVSVQLPGSFLRVPVPAFLAVIEAIPNVRRRCLRYVQTFLVQLTSSVMAGALLTIEARLARWLLMCHDRAASDELVMTHEFLATMLSVRRPGLTTATHVLEGNGLICAKCGKIIIRDRAGLEELAEGTYGPAEREYERLIGSRLSRSAGIAEAGHRAQMMA
jgi:CRP-like cAMP-binding protein